MNVTKMNSEKDSKWLEELMLSEIIKTSKGSKDSEWKNGQGSGIISEVNEVTYAFGQHFNSEEEPDIDSLKIEEPATRVACFIANFISEGTKALCLILKAPINGLSIEKEKKFKVVLNKYKKMKFCIHKGDERYYFVLLVVKKLEVLEETNEAMGQVMDLSCDENAIAYCEDSLIDYGLWEQSETVIQYINFKEEEDTTDFEKFCEKLEPAIWDEVTSSLVQLEAKLAQHPEWKNSTSYNHKKQNVEDISNDLENEENNINEDVVLPASAPDLFINECNQHASDEDSQVNTKLYRSLSVIGTAETSNFQSQ